MIVLYWIVGVVAYLGIAVKAAQATLRWQDAIFPRLGLEDADIVFHAVMALFWPISFFSAWMTFAPKKTPKRTATRLRKLLVR